MGSENTKEEVPHRNIYDLELKIMYNIGRKKREWKSTKLRVVSRLDDPKEIMKNKDMMKRIEHKLYPPNSKSVRDIRVLGVLDNKVIGQYNKNS